jgi:hypothetical protein
MSRRRGVTVLPLLWLAFAGALAIQGGEALAQQLDSSTISTYEAPTARTDWQFFPAQ